MNVSCDVIWDIMPLYTDGVCSEESKKIVDAHLAECEACRQRMESLSKDKEVETDFTPKLDPLKKIRKANAKKTTWVALAAIVVVVSLIVGWMAYRHVFNIVDAVWSDDGTSAFVIYDRAIGVELDDDQRSNFTMMEYTGLSGNRSEGFFLHWFGGSEVRYNWVFEGVYENGSWSPDGSKFVVNVDASFGDVHIIDRVNKGTFEIDYGVSVLIADTINSSPEQFGYGLPDEPEGYLEFLQWSEDSSAILLYYRFADTSGENQSGYCWYDYENNTVSGFLVSEQ